MIWLKGTPLKSLIFISNKWRPPKQTPSLLISVVTAENQDIARKTVANLSAPEADQSSNQSFLGFPNPQGLGSEALQGRVPILSSSWFTETTLQMGNECRSVLIATAATLSVHSPAP